MAQTQEQIAFIIREWEARFKNPNLLSTDHNVNEIIAYVNREGGDITIQKLVDAIRNLGDIDNGGHLQYHHAPKETIIFKTPEESAQQKRQRELVEKDIAGGFQRGLRTELDRPIPKYVAEEKAAYVPSPVVPDLPPVPASCPPLNSKADIDNIKPDVWKQWHYGKFQVQFRKRVNEILRRHAAAQAAAQQD